MKRVIYFLIIIIFNGTSAYSQSVKNERAIDEVEKRLKIIKDFVTDVDSDSSLRRVEAVYFMEKLTKLYSESDANDVGKLNPTERDYKKWNEWYEQNKSKLQWNKRKKKVVVKD